MPGLFYMLRGGIRNGMSAAVRLKSGQGWPRQRMEESLRRRTHEVFSVVGESPIMLRLRCPPVLKDRKSKDHRQSLRAQGPKCLIVLHFQFNHHGYMRLSRPISRCTGAYFYYL